MSHREQRFAREEKLFCTQHPLFQISSYLPTFGNCDRQLFAAMTSSNYKFVVFGTRNAACYVAREFVARGIAFQSLCLIFEEHLLPCELLAPSDAVFVEESAHLPGFRMYEGESGVLQTQEWFDKHGIVSIFGECVELVNVASRILRISTGRSIIASDALILTTGSTPIYMTELSGLDDINYLRDSQQARRLFDALQAKNKYRNTRVDNVVGSSILASVPGVYAIGDITPSSLSTYTDFSGRTEGVTRRRDSSERLLFPSNDFPRHEIMSNRIASDDVENDRPPDPPRLDGRELGFFFSKWKAGLFAVFISFFISGFVSYFLYDYGLIISLRVCWILGSILFFVLTAATVCILKLELTARKELYIRGIACEGEVCFVGLHRTVGDRKILYSAWVVKWKYVVNGKLYDAEVKLKRMLDANVGDKVWTLYDANNPYSWVRWESMISGREYTHKHLFGGADGEVTYFTDPGEDPRARFIFSS